MKERQHLKQFIYEIAINEKLAQANTNENKAIPYDL